jgi:hypothetical protein
MTVPFHYDSQIRRFLLQFTRMFSHFQVEYGRSDDGSEAAYRTVPIKYGDVSRQAQTVQHNNSANVFPSAPALSFYINSLDYKRDRVQEPQFVDKKHVRQREYNTTSQTYDTTQGNAFTVERFMPAPYDLGITLDVWSSNTTQKLQILEQILPLFNPSFEIQSTDNYLDWTSLSVVELNNTTWKTKAIPAGLDDSLDVSSLNFTIPIWLSSPAKVMKGGVVHKIIASIYDDDGTHIDAISNDDLLLGTRSKITPHGYQILLINNQLQILEESTIEDPKNNSFNNLTAQSSSLLWNAVLHDYPDFENGISQIRLENPDTGANIVGTATQHPTDDRYMLYSIDTDTLPQNSMDPVDAVVNPLSSGPGITVGNVAFPNAIAGQRYLLTESIGDSSNTSTASAWAGSTNTQLIANTNDVIEYDGNKWFVAFDSSTIDDVAYITNLTTNLQYKWTGLQWLRSVEGIYRGGDWAIVL